MNTDLYASLQDLLNDDGFIRYVLGDVQDLKWSDFDKFPDVFKEKVEQARSILLGNSLGYSLSEDESLDLKNRIFDTLNLAKQEYLQKS